MEKKTKQSQSNCSSEEDITRYVTEKDGINDGTNDGINDGINNGIKKHLGETEQAALNLIIENSRLTARELAESLALKTRQAERILASLEGKGLITRIGPNKGGHWEVND